MHGRIALIGVCFATLLVSALLLESHSDPQPVRHQPVDEKILIRRLLSQSKRSERCRLLIHRLGIEQLKDMRGLDTYDELMDDESWNWRFKTMVFQSPFRAVSGRRCIAFVFDQQVHSWPGSQPQTIIITDSQCRLLTWKEVGGSPMFCHAWMEVVGNDPTTLTIACNHRFLRGFGVYRYVVEPSGVRRLGDVEWIDKQHPRFEDLLNACFAIRGN